MSHAASAGNDDVVLVWPLGDGATEGGPHSLSVQDVEEVAWSPDGGTLATGTSTGVIALWDTQSWSCRAELSGHRDKIGRIAWSPDGQELLTGSYDGTVRVWDAKAATFVALLERGEWITDVAWNPVRRQALIAPWADAAVLWPIPADPMDASPVTLLTGHSAVLHSADWSPDGSMAVTTSGDGTARIWDSATGSEIRRLSTGEAFTSAWNPKGQRILTGSRDGILRIWDVAGGADVMLLRHPDAVCSARWSPDGAQIISGCGDGGVRRWAVDPTAVLTELAERVSRLFTEEEIRREIPQWTRPPGAEEAAPSP